ncbi:MAG: porin [Methylococcales bacterium]|nr:porin [Methylococcales bacterium]
MFSKYRSLSGLCLLALSVFSTHVHALTVDELAAQFESYKQQQALEFEKIRSENQALIAHNNTLKKALKNTQAQVENNAVAFETVADAFAESGGGSSWTNDTSIGGYGELHYTNLSTEKTSGNGHEESVDFHRYVLFFNHEFNDKLRLFTELELEHSLAGDGKKGEIELEQAWMQYDITHNAAVRAGILLMPVGILNEIHEPDTFYGVDRNLVETKIIPATWWEAGLAGQYQFDNGLQVDAMISSGLELGNSYEIRGGRQKVSKQEANDPLFALRLKYTGITGLRLSGTVMHQTDMAQSSVNNAVDVGSGTLVETHAIYNRHIGPGTFTTKALFSQWFIDINDASKQGADNQTGYFLEPSYRMPTPYGDIGIYGRYSYLDYYKNGASEYDVWEGGLNWWIDKNVVVKADWQYQNKRNGLGDKRGFNLGLGYQFY